MSADITYEAQYFGPEGWLVVGAGYTYAAAARDHCQRWMELPNATAARVVQVTISRLTMQEWEIQQ